MRRTNVALKTFIGKMKGTGYLAFLLFSIFNKTLFWLQIMLQKGLVYGTDWKCKMHRMGNDGVSLFKMLNVLRAG